MAKQPKYPIENPDILFYENFQDEQTVIRQGGNPNAGTIPVVFSHGVATFDNSAVGVDNHISYPATQMSQIFSESRKLYNI